MNLNRSANLRNQSVNIIDKNLTGKQATVNFSKLELKQKNAAGSNKSYFDTLLSQKSNNYMDSISSYYLKN